MSECTPESEPPRPDQPVEGETGPPPEDAKQAGHKQISEVPLLTFEPRLGSRLQSGLGLLFVLTWFGGDAHRAWPWDPVRQGEFAGGARAILPIAGFLLLASYRSRPQVRMIWLALGASIGLWHGAGASWEPVPNWFLGGQWATAAPVWCFLLTPAFAILVGGVLGAGPGKWSRLRVFMLAACALTAFVFFWWPLRDQILQESFIDEVRIGSRDSIVLGSSLAVLWGSAVMLVLACAVAAMRGKFDVRVHSLCVRVLMVFVVALLVSRLTAAGGMPSVSLVRSFVFLLNALATTLREIALAGSLALLVALWCEHREGRRTRGWEQAF